MPRTPFSDVLNTLLYILITGCRWRDVPQKARKAKQGVHAADIRPIATCKMRN